MKKNIFIGLFLMIGMSMIAQVDKTSELFKILKAKDSLLFTVGFNTCDIQQFETLTSDNFEFYHDQSGVLSSKSEFILNTKNGLCKSKDYQARRELIKGSLEVFALRNKGVIYGALQMGVHRFYGKQKGKEEVYGSTAKFTHLWIKEDNDWKLSRVLSYDHNSNKEDSK